MMAFASKSNLSPLFRMIQVAGLLLALGLALVGTYQLFLGQFLIGTIMALLGVLIFSGAIRLKAYSFQIAFLAYLFVAFAVLINAWLPSPDPSFLIERHISVLLSVLLLLLAVGSVFLARRIFLGSHRPASKSRSNVYRK